MTSFSPGSEVADEFFYQSIRTVWDTVAGYDSLQMQQPALNQNHGQPPLMSWPCETCVAMCMY